MLRPKEGEMKPDEALKHQLHRAAELSPKVKDALTKWVDSVEARLKKKAEPK